VSGFLFNMLNRSVKLMTPATRAKGGRSATGSSLRAPSTPRPSCATCCSP
jgi:hypothetical protein